MTAPTRMRSRDLPDDVNEVSGHVLDAAIEVHRSLGPGLLESAYRDCLAHELRLRGFVVERERYVAVEYKGLALPKAYRADIIVNGKVIVEAKAAQDFAPTDEAQVLTYLYWTGIQLGILLNFHVDRIRDGGFRRLAATSPRILRGPRDSAV